MKKMKKMQAMVLIGSFMLTLVACGTTEGNENNSNLTQNVVEVVEEALESDITNMLEDSTETEEVVENESGVALTNTFKVAGNDIYVDTPNWQAIEHGYTELFILNGIKYVAFSMHYDEIPSTVEEAHEIAFAKFLQNIQNYSQVNSLSIEKESTETINGIEVYRYEGTAECTNGWNLDEFYYVYMVGYSFIMDGIPCTITGSVIDKEQDPDMIDEMRDTVDAMIQTLRSEE